jgi:hypothetical protein
VDAFPDLTSLSDTELSVLLHELENDEDRTSYRRRVLHGRIDVLRSELIDRLRAHVEAGDTVVQDSERVAEAVSHPPDVPDEPTVAAAGEVEALPDLTTLSDDDLRGKIREFEHNEDEISLHRRVLHGRIDILRAERVARAQRRSGGEEPEHVDVERLKDILAANLVSKHPDEER